MTFVNPIVFMYDKTQRNWRGIQILTIAKEHDSLGVPGLKELVLKKNRGHHVLGGGFENLSDRGAVLCG